MVVKNGEQLVAEDRKQQYSDAKNTKTLPIKLPLKDAKRFEELAKIISDNSWGLTLIRLMDNFEKDYKYELVHDALVSLDNRVSILEKNDEQPEESGVATFGGRV